MARYNINLAKICWARAVNDQIKTFGLASLVKRMLQDTKNSVTDIWTDIDQADIDQIYIMINQK